MLAYAYPYRIVTFDLLYRIWGIFGSVIGDGLSDTAVAIYHGNGRSGYAAARRGQDQAQQERPHPVPLAG